MGGLDGRGVVLVERLGQRQPEEAGSQDGEHVEVLDETVVGDGQMAV